MQTPTCGVVAVDFDYYWTADDVALKLNVTLFPVHCRSGGRQFSVLMTCLDSVIQGRLVTFHFKPF
jgi:hypothetical protein